MSKNLKYDSRSTEEIIQLASNEEDEHNYWNYVYILHFRGGEEEFIAASFIMRKSKCVRKNFRN